MTQTMATTSGGPRGPVTLANEHARVTALIPFILPQVLFQGGQTQQKMGPGLAVRVNFTSSNTDYTVTHNLGHPVLMVWAALAPAGFYAPKVGISTTANANTTSQVILRADTAVGQTTVVIF